jgi:hypothetical protein
MDPVLMLDLDSPPEKSGRISRREAAAKKHIVKVPNRKGLLMISNVSQL